MGVRANDGSKVSAKLRKLYMYLYPLASPVSTTLTADSAIDAAALAFLKTGFATGDWVLVDSALNQELVKLGTIPVDSSPIPLKLFTASRIHLVGAKVRKVTRVDLGYIEDGGVNVSASSSATSLTAANADSTIYDGRPSIGARSASWKVREASIEAWALALGAHEGIIAGTGSADAAKKLMLHPDNMAQLQDYAFGIETLMADGTTQYVHLLNPTPLINLGDSIGAKDSPLALSHGCNFTHKFIYEI